MVASRLFLAALMAAGSLAPCITHAAGTGRTVASDASVEIIVTPWMDVLPRSGMMPLSVQITNRAAQDRTWIFVTREDDYRAGDMTGNFQVHVPGGGVTNVSFLVNTLPDADSSSRGYKNLNIMVSGPGTVPGIGIYLNATAGPGYSRSGSAAKWSPYIAKSDQFDLAYRKDFKAAVEDQMHMQWLGDTVVMSHAPVDWRGYTSLAQLWMVESEWTGISEAQRQALLTWVGTGGTVYVVTSGSAGTVALPEGLAWSGSTLHYGSGFIDLVPADGVTPAVVRGLPAKMVVRQLSAQPASASERLSALVAPLTLRGPLIFSFILVFGILVGPVNLFWFARGRNRPRLFWTTPLISFAGSAVLVVIMLMQDGTGGAGARVLLATTLPQQKQMVVLQEQFSKTGVLLNRAFELPEHDSTWLVPLPVIHTVASAYSGSGEREEKRSYELAGQRASGGWFASRAVQGQLLQSVRLNRGGIDLQEGASPTAISSLGTSLTRLYVMDRQKKMWTAENVATGQRITLSPVSREAFEAWLRSSVKTHMGGFLRAQVDAGIPAAGPWFFAEAAAPERIAVPTLNSIRWEHDRAYLIGPADAGPGTAP